MTNREAAIKVVKRLREKGYQALFAGGCVRDMLLKRPAKDFDVATDARPDEVVKLFRRTLKVGAKFGVVMVLLGKQQIEVATFRTESGYADGRHPDKVEFAGAEEDAKRRDFTINGMFYDPIGRKVIDYVGARADLAKGLVRTIGVAHERFVEDYLRMLRAVRFATQLDFQIDNQTWLAVCRFAGRIHGISAERIAVELESILTHPKRTKGAALLIESGLAEAIFGPDKDKHFRLGLEVLGELPERIDFAIALAGFFAGYESTEVMQKCTALKLSNTHSRHLRYLTTGRGRLTKQMELGEFKLLLAEPYFGDLLELETTLCRARGEDLTALQAVRIRAGRLAGKELKPKPLLDGHALIALGARPGPMVGLLGREMYIAQLSEKLKTVKQTKEWVKDWLERHREL